jgi:hypothetical protein
MNFEDSDLDDDKAAELDRLVRVARTRRPDPNVTGRVAQRLGRAGAFTTTASTTSTEAHPALRLGAVKLTGALALLGLGSALFVSVTRGPDAPPVSPAASLSAPAALSPSPSFPHSPSAVEDPPSMPVDALPSSATTAKTSTERPRAVAPGTSARRTPEPITAPKPEGEVVLIRRARTALPSDPSGALTFLEEHARTFSNGELAQEREVMAVEALARLDRKNEAKRRAQSLLERFPRTPYVARLELAIGEQLTEAVPANTPR